MKKNRCDGRVRRGAGGGGEWFRLEWKVGEWSPPLLRPTLRALVFGVPRSGTGAVRVLALWDGRTT
jgi:hypothetical protein